MKRTLLCIMVLLLLLAGCGKSKEEKEKEKVFQVIDTLIQNGYKIEDVNGVPTLGKTSFYPTAGDLTIIALMGFSDNQQYIKIIFYFPDFEISTHITQLFNQDFFVYGLSNNETNEMFPPCLINLSDYSLRESSASRCEELLEDAVKEYNTTIQAMVTDYGVSIEDLSLDYDYIRVYYELKDK